MVVGWMICKIQSSQKKILKIDFWSEYPGDSEDELARCVADKI